MKILFVTSSKAKHEWARDRLRSVGIELEHSHLDISESRDLDAKDVAIAKAKEAFKVLKKPLIVEDRGFYIDALNGFPATFVSLMHKTIGVKGIMKLMEGVSNRKALFISVLAYIDAKGKVITFEEREEGFIVEKLVEGDCRGWGDIMEIYGHEAYPGKALSELSDEEWDNYQNIIAKEDYLLKFCDWFRKKYKK